MESLLAQFSSFKVTTYSGVEDAADKASFLFSVAIMVVCCIVITTNQYFLEPISCYVPVMASGKGLDKFIVNYCWVHGTIPLMANESLPNKKGDWYHLDQHRRLNYYQWVAFVLGLQGVLFYVPRLIWQTIIYNLSGTDLEGLVNSSKQAANRVGKARQDTVEQVARCLEDMFFQRRFLDHNKHPLLRKKASMFCCSRRTGVFLFSLYFLIKLLYLVNAACQILLMQFFLKIGTSKLDSAFGISLIRDISEGRQWTDNLMFPRVTFCYIGNVTAVGLTNNYVAQCALPVNMLNEKVFIFLWFWIVGVLALTVLSIPVWIYKMTFLRKRQNFVKKYLKIKSVYDKSSNRAAMDRFVTTFLRHDGVFILHIMSLNAGDLITTDIVTKLWEIYKENYSDSDFRKPLPPKTDLSSDQTYV